MLGALHLVYTRWRYAAHLHHQQVLRLNIRSDLQPKPLTLNLECIRDEFFMTVATRVTIVSTLTATVAVTVTVMTVT